MYRFLLFVVFEGEAANKPEKSGFFICFYLASVRPRVVLTRRDKVRLPLALSSLIKPIFPKTLQKPYQHCVTKLMGGLVSRRRVATFCFHIGSSGLKKQMHSKPVVRRCCHPPA